jgi:hypothetical protein
MRSRLDMAGERISEPDDMPTETSQTEGRINIKKKKKKKNIHGSISYLNSKKKKKKTVKKILKTEENHIFNYRT